MIKYLIIDDEAIAHDIIQGYCDLLPDMQLVKNCYDAIDALAFLKENKVDLIFLDLNLPKLKGFEFLKTLINPPKVIVTTAYREFALEGYELNIVDYLLKPFSFERFLKAINKASLSKEKNTESPLSEENVSQTIFLKSNKKLIQVSINDILFLESAGNYVKVITSNETITVRDKISELLVKLPQNQFYQVHKSFAVSKQHIQHIEGNRISIGDHKIPIGQKYKELIKRILF